MKVKTFSFILRDPFFKVEISNLKELGLLSRCFSRKEHGNYNKLKCFRKLSVKLIQIFWRQHKNTLNLVDEMQQRHGFEGK